MIDANVCNVLSETNSVATSYICGASPKEMSLVNISEKSVKKDKFRFNLSTQHCWIRYFEYLLFTSYRGESGK